MNSYSLEPIAFVKNSRKIIEDDFWGNVVSEIELVPSIPAEAFEGIDTFSHLEIIFLFHLISPDQILKSSGHPRENTDWPVTGIFAQRKKNRPNRLGSTIVEVIRREGNKLFVKYLDALDGTPVLDIKPVLKEFLPQKKIVQPQWATELMKDYWKA